MYKMCKKYSHNMNINIHPHMLRHGCGYALANQGLDTRLIQDYLGTEIYIIRYYIQPVMQQDLNEYGRVMC